MSIPAIGLENLPNIYFSNVDLENNIMEAQLTMKDFIENPSWSSSEILYGILNIKVLTISFNEGEPGEQIAMDLKNGDTSIHDILGYPMRIIAAQNYNESETLQTNLINNFYYNVRLTATDIDFAKQNIYIFAVAYIDLTSLNLDYASYKYFDGPMASETIRENNNTPLNASLFKLEDGTIWAGPVHKNLNNFMEGSFHKEQLHGELSQEFVDSKVSEFIFSINDNTHTRPYRDPIVDNFSEFYHLDQDKEFSLVFVDISNIALNELQSARELFNTNEKYFYELMKNFRVLNFEIRKAPVKTRLEFLDIGTSDWVYDEDREQILVRTSMVDGTFVEKYEMRFFSQQFSVDPNALIETTTSNFDIQSKSTFESSKKVGHIKQLPSNEQFLYNLMIVDELYYSDESEDYKLKMIIDVADSFRTDLEKTKQNMLSIISDLEITYTGLFGKLDKRRIINFFANNGILIDDSLNFVNIESQSLFDNSIFARLQTSLQNMLLAILPDDQIIQGVINNTLKNLYINSVSKEKYNLVIEFLNNLVSHFINKYNLSRPGKDTNMKASSSRTININRKLQNIIEINRVKEGNFSYFEKSENKRIISIDEMKSRANAEYNKFFNRQISAKEILNISPDIGKENAEKMTDFDTSKFAFYTPTSYNQGDKKLDLSQPDMSIFDEKIHNAITDNMFEIKARPKPPRRAGKPQKRSKLGKAPRRGKKKLLSTLNIRRPFKKSKITGEDVVFENASEYVGDSSLFLTTNLGTRRKQIIPPSGPVTLIKQVFCQDKKITKFNEISIDDQNSILLKNKNNIDFSRLPLQFRALILSNYNLSRFSFPLQEDKLIQNAKFSNTINNIFNRVRTAQYVDGFEKDSKGLRRLNSPVYRPVDLSSLNSGKTLIIKLFKYSNGTLQMEKEDLIPSTNSFFAIEGTIKPASISQSEDLTNIKIMSRIEKEYSTTNIVKQNPQRQELNSFVNQDKQTTEQPQSRANNVRRNSTLRPTRGNY
tara:strand:- start:6134 stop:9118 length:2985 start_codon:yes stop_codon:yes gene_type:complete